MIVHTREADQDTIRILKDAGKGEVRGVFHCFTGNAALAAAALQLGFYLSFSGIVSFPKSDALRAVAATVPADRLLIETDSPTSRRCRIAASGTSPPSSSTWPKRWPRRGAPRAAAIVEQTAANFAALFDKK